MAIAVCGRGGRLLRAARRRQRGACARALLISHERGGHPAPRVSGRRARQLADQRGQLDSLMARQLVGHLASHLAGQLTRQLASQLISQLTV